MSKTRHISKQMLSTLVGLFFCMSLIQTTFANPSDSLIVAFHQSKDVDERFDIAYKVAVLYISTPKICFPILHEAIRDSSRATDDFIVGKVVRALGVLHFYQASLDSALYYYQNALGVFERIGEETESVKTKKNIGLVYSNQGDYPEAIKMLMEVHAYFESINDTVSNIANFNDIGNAFALSNNDDKALAYQFKALELLAQFPNPSLEGNVYNSIGYVYAGKEQLDSAVYYYEKSLKLKERYGNVYSQLNTRNNLCECYSRLDKYEKAILCYEQLIPLQREVNDQEGLFRAYLNIANENAKLKNYQKAIRLLDDIVPLLNSISTLKNQMDFYRNLQWILAGSGNYKKAYEAQKLYQTLRDSLFNEEKNHQIIELSTKYEVEKKNSQLAENKEQLTAAQNEMLIAQLHVKNRNFWLLALGLISLLVILISVFLIQRQRAESALEKSQAVIAERDRGTLALVDAQEEERLRIAKELHDGVGNQLLALHLKWQSLDKKIDFDKVVKKEFEAGSKMLKDVMDEVRSVSHQMMPKVLSEFGLIPAIEEMLHRSLSTTTIKHRFDASAVNQKLDKKLEVAIYRILQELINNVIKHSNATEVQVQLFSNPGYLILILEDDGKGIPTDKNPADGIGLTSIRSRLHTINGEFSIVPGPYTGTLVTIRIPIK
ncbi:MAG: sensor histidine kinase [Bacteroidales bacterium]|nr:sensor histidine kinase [Bacteroidales bacterium]